MIYFVVRQRIPPILAKECDNLMKYATIHYNDDSLRVAEVRDNMLYPYIKGKTLYDVMAHDAALDPNASPVVWEDANWRAPLRPSKIMCVGRNYAAHAAELGNDVPERPLIFAKYPTCVIGAGETIRWRTEITDQVDWEGELAVIIGKTAKRISEDQAFEHIFGYTVANDVSARDLQSTEGQWTRAKGHDTFCPLGPVVVTRDEIPDPHNLRISTMVNGETKQDSTTGNMFFKVAYLVAYLSQTFTLEAGDIILTGTPAGVGKGMKPPQFLHNGDTVSVTIEGIGTLTNGCVVE
jgi:2-keto-4-pentenoate hydratase/2-oxohepta-3-ene-1,7-dioic acid hydratase in catechol pathway